MIKKTIKFKDYDDKDQVEDFYFNISKGEAVMMEMAAVDAEVEGLTDKIERLMKSRNGKEIVEVFKDIMSLSYGVKTADGRFLKEDALGRPLAVHFRSTGAYSELAFELATNAELGAEFINGLMPKTFREDVRKEVADRQDRTRTHIEETGRGFAPPEGAKVPLDYQPKKEPSSIQVLPDPVPSENLDNLSREDLIARLSGSTNVVRDV